MITRDMLLKTQILLTNESKTYAMDYALTK